MTLGGIPKGKIDAALTARQAPLSAYPITAAVVFDLTSETNLTLQTTSAQKNLNVQANIETAKANPAFRLAVTGDLDLDCSQDLIGTEAELQNVNINWQVRTTLRSFDFNSRRLCPSCPTCRSFCYWSREENHLVRPSAECKHRQKHAAFRISCRFDRQEGIGFGLGHALLVRPQRSGQTAPG